MKNEGKNYHPQGSCSGNVCTKYKIQPNVKCSLLVAATTVLSRDLTHICGPAVGNRIADIYPSNEYITEFLKPLVMEDKGRSMFHVHSVEKMHFLWCYIVSQATQRRKWARPSTTTDTFFIHSTNMHAPCTHIQRPTRQTAKPCTVMIQSSVE